MSVSSVVFRVVHTLTFRWQLQIINPYCNWWWLIVHLVWSNFAFVIGAWIRMLYVQFILKSKSYRGLLKLLSSWQSDNCHVKRIMIQGFWQTLTSVLKSVFAMFSGVRRSVCCSSRDSYDITGRYCSELCLLVLHVSGARYSSIAYSISLLI